MEIKVEKCFSCDEPTYNGKRWRTGALLCPKCYKKWDEKDKFNDSSVQESVIKRIKKRRIINKRKKIVTKIHKDGEQLRLNIN
jgi:hypothetical protein